MANEEYTQKTQITPRKYIEDYLKHYSRHRSVVVTNLLKDWQENNTIQNVILGSRVLMEFGASIEELFAFTYAIHKLYEVENDDSSEEKEAFFKHLFDYRHKKLWDFANNNKFNNWIETHFFLPSRQKMAQQMNISIQVYGQCLSDAEQTLEDMKDDFFIRGFQHIYNKLKHPFLVLAPVQQDGTGETLLPVLLKSSTVDVVANIKPVKVELSELELFKSKILNVSKVIEFLLKLVIDKP